MSASIVAACAAAPAVVFGSIAVGARRHADALARRLTALERRESDVLEAVRVLTAASRDSSHAVLAALDAVIRVVEPCIDAVLVYRPESEELACIYAAGARAEHYSGTRLRIDDPRAVPARAALHRTRAYLAPGSAGAIPTDRAALAVPMEDASGLRAVVYAATKDDAPMRECDAIVRAVVQAAASYALALDHERDRAHATYDGLTGLHTPRAFRETLKEEIAAARLLERVTLSLWFIDTDHFKRVNDTLGHATGDLVLQRMAALLREHTVTGVDLAARNGGDEFCAIVRNAQKTAAIERAQQLCEAVRRCDFGVGMPVTASIGVATFPYDGAGADELLEMADAAMYHSKRSGRDCVSFSVGGPAFAVYR